MTRKRTMIAMSFLLLMITSTVFANTVLLESDPRMQKELEGYERAGICLKPNQIVREARSGSLTVEADVVSVIKADSKLPRRIALKVSAFDREFLLNNLNGGGKTQCFDLVRKSGESAFEFLGGVAYSELKETPSGYISARQAFYKTENK